MGVIKLRKSIEAIRHMVDNTIEYDGLPDELKPYYVYFNDCGHSIMVIPKSLFGKYPEAEKWELESAVPVKYVLSHPYEIVEGYIVMNVPYHGVYGVNVGDEYEEY